MTKRDWVSEFELMAKAGLTKAQMRAARGAGRWVEGEAWARVPGEGVWWEANSAVEVIGGNTGVSALEAEAVVTGIFRDRAPCEGAVMVPEEKKPPSEALVRAAGPSGAAGGAKNGAPLAGGVERLVVRRADFLNRQIIECVRGGDEQRVRLRVRSADRFVPGMAILGRRWDGGVWSFAGNPATPDRGVVWPRWKGKW